LPLQPRRLIAPAAVGGKRLLDGCLR
jgi:hypothetical protein